jgi:hypothetical protein
MQQALWSARRVSNIVGYILNIFKPPTVGGAVAMQHIATDAHLTLLYNGSRRTTCRCTPMVQPWSVSKPTTDIVAYVDPF